MSEKSKGDTSRIVNNPLLSASVTGLTFDDFPSAPLLLPAAPPIERSPPPVLDLNSDDKEPTNGQSLEHDSDAFSEINLNATSDEDYTQPAPTSFISPLEENPSIPDSSLLSQAASSFSQLPSVASTVLSTFSKVIKDYSPTSQYQEDINTLNPDPQASVTFDHFYIPEQQESNRIIEPNLQQQPLEPPKFYTPAEIPQIPTAPSIQNTNQNTYRLSAKRKTYAPIPGLSSNIHQPIANTLPTPLASLPPPPPSQSPQVENFDLPSTEQAFDSFANSGPVFNLQPAIPNIQPFAEVATKKEERKGLFSLSNVVAPVWQNLSGLVGRGGGQEDQSNIQAPLFGSTSNNPQSFLQQPPPYSPNNQQPFSTGFSPNQSVATPQQYSIPVDSNKPIPQVSQFFNQQGLSPSPADKLTPPSLVTAPPIDSATITPANSSAHSQLNLEQATPPPTSHIYTPPLSYFPGVQKSTPPPVAITPPTVGLPNLNLINSSHTSEGSPRPLHQLPPAGVGNTFRLQKGTRHYKTPLGISTNPVSSNILQPFVNEVPQSSVNPPLPPSNPVVLEKSAELQVAANSAFISPISTYASTFEPIIAVPAQNPETNYQFQQQTQRPLPLDNQLSSPLVPSSLAQATDTKNSLQTDTFHNQQSSLQASTLSLDEAISSSQVDIQTGKFPENPSSSVECTLNEGPIENKSTSAIVDSFENKPPANQREIHSPLIEKAIQELSLASEDNSTGINTLASNLSSEQQQLITNQIESTNAFIDPNLNKHIPGDRNPDLTYKLPDEKEPTPTVAQPFNLTNYFSVQSNITVPSYAQPQPDFNANNFKGQPDNSCQSIVQAPVNFFSQTYSGQDSKNNNAKAAIESLPDPISFFDSFHDPKSSSTPVVNQTEDNLNCSADIDSKSEIENSFQIQNFFNNPPQTLNPSANDLNYKLVGSNLIKKKYTDNISSRAISPSSNVVEPPSSACSEFSADASFQSPVNLSKLANVDIPGELSAELNESVDPEVMALLASNKQSSIPTVYHPAVKHWFYKKKVDEKFIWTPFSQQDSELIESHYNDPTATKVVGVEGGRYDVNINERLRLPIFWSGDATEVRRCSWFYRAVDSRYVPYDESIAEKLETEYEDAFKSGEWHRRISLPTGEAVVFHGPTVMVHFHQTQPSDSWGASTQTTSRSRTVKRDLEDFNIETGESNKVDHLLFMVHGIGSVCDLKFRTVEEVVDEFRNIAIQLVQSHYKNSCECGNVGRVEVLPVSWHSELHSEESGVDEKLKAITLESIPKLRNFTNDTLLDILFYTSPVFCQNIMDTVAGTMNKVYSKYCQRNPKFNGGVSLAGHSLGSLILFDLLCHQKPIDNAYLQNSENPDQPITPLQIRAQTPTNDEGTTSKQISYTIGPAGTGQAFISYPQLIFQPKKFFALGSPIGMFVTIRGIDRLGLDFKLPTCPGFYNIFHPYDPVAYRIEALVNTDLSSARPVLIPHHKGRKRLHLELKETMTRVGADIKQKIVDTFKNTFGTVYQLTSRQKTTPDQSEIEKEVDKVLEMQLKMDKEARSRTNSTSTHSDVDTGEVDLPLGKLNEGKRIDYVLQEAPLEFFNEYLFALTSHVCYWESADTILFLMKEIYSSLGVQTDNQVPQQTMTIERPASTSLYHYDFTENPDDHNSFE